METQSLARELSEAFIELSNGSETSLERLLRLYDDEVEFKDPMQDFRGKKAFEQYNRRLIKRARSIDVRIHEVVGIGDTIWMTWTMEYEPRFAPQLTVDGVTHAKVRDGRVVSQRDYWDLAGSAIGAIPGVRAAYREVVRRLS